jgi:hypothetical protein
MIEFGENVWKIEKIYRVWEIIPGPTKKIIYYPLSMSAIALRIG